MAMTYQAWLKYEYEGAAGSKKQLTVPVVRFKVAGGADRVIKMDSTSDISLTSELEQARTFKNIVLGMPPSNNGDDMRAAVDLTDAANKIPVFIEFYLYKFSDGKALEGLSLRGWDAKIKHPPQIVQGLLKIEISLDGEVKVGRLVVNPGQKTKYFPF